MWGSGLVAALMVFFTFEMKVCVSDSPFINHSVQPFIDYTFISNYTLYASIVDYHNVPIRASLRSEFDFLVYISLACVQQGLNYLKKTAMLSSSITRHDRNVSI